MTLARLFSTCLFGHSADWHNGPLTEQGRVKRCDRCQQPIGYMLAGEMITTPLAQVVPGAPTSKAKLVTRANVRPWKVSTR